MQNKQEIQASLNQTFDLNLPDTFNEEQIIQALSQRIAELLYRNSDQLFSMLYRLDISEKSIKSVLDQSVDVYKSLATLIYERQIDKMKLRQQYKSPPPEEDLAW